MSDSELAAKSEGGESAEAAILAQEIEKRITEAFLVFDTQANRQADVREIGTIVRSLGLVPTEAEVNELISETEDETASGFVRLDRLLPVLTQCILEKRYRPVPENILLKAFEALDTDKKGYLLPEEISNYLREEGEPFLQEELEEFLSAAVDPSKGKIFYKDYVALLSVDDAGLFQ
ncbi:unnamed protein product [Oikopleura dioica]|uniref:EF-hand domain-containing protein n=1 Tax=Oikopleura dioica TaxID=34765 RepID=E4Y459_OIKDI|nr:unnamed protein product [Oikopleura dioica]